MESEYLIDWFNERVAIRIHDGRLTEKQAIKAAYFDLRSMTEATIPQDVKDQVKEVQDVSNAKAV